MTLGVLVWFQVGDDMQKEASVWVVLKIRLSCSCKEKPLEIGPDLIFKNK